MFHLYLSDGGGLEQWFQDPGVCPYKVELLELQPPAGFLRCPSDGSGSASFIFTDVRATGL